MVYIRNIYCTKLRTSQRKSHPLVRTKTQKVGVLLFLQPISIKLTTNAHKHAQTYKMYIESKHKSPSFSPRKISKITRRDSQEPVPRKGTDQRFFCEEPFLLPAKPRSRPSFWTLWYRPKDIELPLPPPLRTF